MSRFVRKVAVDSVEHDISKELFLGIMMLMLCLGIMILNVSKPVWRVHKNDPKTGDVVVVYDDAAFGLSTNGNTIVRRLSEWDFKLQVKSLISDPKTDLHLFLRGGSRERVIRHAAYADSLLSTDQTGAKVRTAVFVHGW
tara:strand:- start:257 stop:676 length:420 start_codon:yes stop_codon:yes gene_type:complete